MFVLISSSSSSNNIGDEGAALIGEVLKLNHTLTSLQSVIDSFDELIMTLRLAGNRIGDEGAASIGEGLKLNHTLTELL